MCGAGRRITPLSFHQPVVAIRRRDPCRPGGWIQRSPRVRLHPLVQNVRHGGCNAPARAPQLADLLLAQDALHHAEHDQAEDHDEEDREEAATTHLSLLKRIAVTRCESAGTSDMPMCCTCGKSPALRGHAALNTPATARRSLYACAPAQGGGMRCADFCSKGNGALGDLVLAKVRVSLTSRRHVTGASGLGPGSGDTGWWRAGRYRRTVS